MGSMAAIGYIRVSTTGQVDDGITIRTKGDGSCPRI